MKPEIEHHITTVLGHLYINPLEKCNLKCKICYTRKTSPILSSQQILDFVSRYKQAQKLETITFCGGEVFALEYFPKLVNELTGQGIFIQTITNGTIDKLADFSHPNLINLIVSLDGLPSYHDKNRGEGTFSKSLQFLKKAQELGFHTDIFSIVTKQNLSDIDAFESYIRSHLSQMPVITYHPRKPPLYLTTHPVSNIVGETAGFDFLDKSEMLRLMRTRNVFPPKDLGCYQIALVSDGRIFGCCEGTVPLGNMNDEISYLTDKLRERIQIWSETNTQAKCLGCSQSDFMCGIKQYLEEIKYES